MELLEKLLLQVAGPLVTVIFGTLIVGTFVARITRQAQERRADSLLQEERLRADNQLRDERLRSENQRRLQFIDEMTETASRLYAVSQTYWRKRYREGVSGAELVPYRVEMDQQYRASTIMGEVIERRLEAYFLSPDPRQLWHAAMDLLTVRYFTLIDLATDALLEANEGDEHSGLTIADLRRPEIVLPTYRKVKLPAAARAVMECQMRPLTA